MSNNIYINGTWKKELRLYVHVPFCVRKCEYCDFISGPSDEKTIKKYFESLYTEIRSYKDRAKDYIISSVFIGGGTPSCVDSDYIAKTIIELEDAFIFDKNLIMPEITIEVNPGTIDKTKFLAYKKAGINRISFGLQSCNDKELIMLGRIHTYREFVENYLLARELGFNNINIDLISALPGQTLRSWEETLDRLGKLKPDHISAYSLIIEEGTPFYSLYGPGGDKKDMLPSEDIDREIYKRTGEMLSSYGYDRYEISNYAKKGYFSSHNLAYWERKNYLGLGITSASLINNTRFNNTNSIEEYLRLVNSTSDIIPITSINKEKDLLMYDAFGIRRDITRLTKNQQIEEFMFLGLRKCKGISKHIFYENFGLPIERVYNNVLLKLESQGLILIDDDMIRLTSYGIDISNLVLAEFLLD
ncbi:MAG: radical SAM family heme chaperone HemW [Bacillota bacterium]|jgi:oxygen-independent coproporphyrinogen-3 oxidase|nr:radical SAM family heme chaperone HemW [Bacillota bacterium]